MRVGQVHPPKGLKGTPGEDNGHTDSDGNELSNLKLSQARAEAVRTYLINQGVAADRLVAVGFGEAMPVESNATAQGKANNRRVEFLIAKQE